eukprot:TRINITY_DN3671_c0_g2_i1.p1 TRINITY_DN3671_c0_g2~~TRINITY_DN3671_c0_g2_i1.p1  ORF type:complete len:479 (-),score=86.10 TRINITY_DN3671_c0_g2_i1:602-2038(-)
MKRVLVIFLIALSISTISAIEVDFRDTLDYKLDFPSFDFSNETLRAQIIRLGRGRFALRPFDEEALTSEDVCAEMNYSKTLNKTGWSLLKLQTRSVCTPLEQMWAGGVLEGFLTHEYSYYFTLTFDSQSSDRPKDKENEMKFFSDLDKSLIKRIKPKKVRNMEKRFRKYYTMVALLRAQFEGFLRGFNHASQDYKMTVEELYYLNTNGETSQMLDVFGKYRSREDIPVIHHEDFDLLSNFQMSSFIRTFKTTNLESFFYKRLQRMHCTVIGRPVRDNDTGLIQDFILTHGTWESFEMLNRIYKTYILGFDPRNFFTRYESDEGQFTMMFSSYPTALFSTDDFYQINDQLIVTETTIDILNQKLFELVLPKDEYVPDFMRIMISNFLSTDAREWSEWLGLINSGTYTSQWMVADYYKVAESIGRDSLVEGTFLVSEQIPGIIITRDMSQYVSDVQRLSIAFLKSAIEWILGILQHSFLR